MINASIYEGYMTESERNLVIADLGSRNELNKINAMYEMVELKEKLAIDEAALKVLKEGGTYDDYVFLVSEAQAEANAQKESIGTKLGEWLKGIIEAITNVIKAIFNIDSKEEVEVDKEELTAFQAIAGVAGSTMGLKKALESGNIDEVTSESSKLLGVLASKPVLFTIGIGGTIAAGGATVAYVGSKAKEDLNNAGKFGILCANVVQWFEDKGQAAKDKLNDMGKGIGEFGSKIGNRIIDAFKYIAAWVRKMCDKIRGLFKKTKLDDPNENNETQNTDTNDNKQDNTSNDNNTQNQTQQPDPVDNNSNQTQTTQNASANTQNQTQQQSDNNQTKKMTAEDKAKLAEQAKAKNALSFKEVKDQGATIKIKKGQTTYFVKATAAINNTENAKIDAVYKTDPTLGGKYFILDNSVISQIQTDVNSQLNKYKEMKKESVDEEFIERFESIFGISYAEYAESSKDAFDTELDELNSLIDTL